MGGVYFPIGKQAMGSGKGKTKRVRVSNTKNISSNSMMRGVLRRGNTDYDLLCNEAMIIEARELLKQHKDVNPFIIMGLLKQTILKKEDNLSDVEIGSGVNVDINLDNLAKLSEEISYGGKYESLGEYYLGECLRWEGRVNGECIDPWRKNRIEEEELKEVLERKYKCSFEEINYVVNNLFIDLLEYKCFDFSLHDLTSDEQQEKEYTSIFYEELLPNINQSLLEVRGRVELSSEVETPGGDDNYVDYELMFINNRNNWDGMNDDDFPSEGGWIGMPRLLTEMLITSDQSLRSGGTLIYALKSMINYL